MGRFDSIYPFTTENIAGYMKNLNLENKKIITVCASGDHVINAIAKGCHDITAFDINPLTKYYLDLKLSAIKSLSYETFLDVFLYDSDKNFNQKIITNLDLLGESKDFWLTQLEKFNGNGFNLKKSLLFNTKYFNPESKLKQNLYLDEKNYNFVKKKIEDISIQFIHSDMKDLKLQGNYDYMFLSNIADYLNLMYDSNPLDSYKEKIMEFHKKVPIIYFAYLYDIGNKNPRSDIDHLEKVKNVFQNVEIQSFETALEKPKKLIKDGVYILKEEI